MIGTDVAQPIGRVIPKPMRIGVVIGEPLDFSRYRGMENDRFILRSVTDEIMYALMSLSGQEYVDIYAATAKARIAAGRPDDAGPWPTPGPGAPAGARPRTSTFRDPPEERGRRLSRMCAVAGDEDVRTAAAAACRPCPAPAGRHVSGPTEGVLPMSVRRVALLTAGGFAPCLSSAVGGLIERYTEIAPEIEIIAYQHGYHGLLTGTKVVVDDEARAKAGVLHRFGGSPIGNSRVKLTNAADCVRRGLVQEGQDPLQVAAEQLKADGVDVLHTIGGDDTNTTAADLAAYLHENGYELTVVGLPKTIDNDVVPIRQSLGAWTAAEEAVALRAEHHRRAPVREPDAHRPRGHGPALRLADRRRRGRVPRLAGHAGVGARASA